MSLARNIPSEIMAAIFSYTPDHVFCQVLSINKEINLKLRDKLYQRIKRRVINTIIRDNVCLSNLNLGEHGNFRCKSSKDRRCGSVFCSFCHHVLLLK